PHRLRFRHADGGGPGDIDDAGTDLRVQRERHHVGEHEDRGTNAESDGTRRAMKPAETRASRGFPLPAGMRPDVVHATWFDRFNFRLFDVLPCGNLALI